MGEVGTVAGMGMGVTVPITPVMWQVARKEGLDSVLGGEEGLYDFQVVSIFLSIWVANLAFVIDTNLHQICSSGEITFLFIS